MFLATTSCGTGASPVGDPRRSGTVSGLVGLLLLLAGVRVTAWCTPVECGVDSVWNPVVTGQLPATLPAEVKCVPVCTLVVTVQLPAVLPAEVRCKGPDLGGLLETRYCDCYIAIMAPGVCSRCGRPRKGHSVPLGPNCTEPILSPEERAKVVAEDDGSDEEIPSTSGTLQELQKKKEELERQHLEQQVQLEVQQKELEEKENRDQIRALRREVEQLSITLREGQSKLSELKTRLDAREGDGNPPYNKTSTKPEGAHAAAPAASPAVAASPADQAPLLDPSLAIYAQAVAQAQADVQGAEGGQSIPIALQAQMLAAACGSRVKGTGITEGKFNPEYYINKSKISNEKERERVSYYEFMHGVLRFLKIRLLEDHKSVDQFIVYYEQIAGFARKYRWHAVHSLHLTLLEEIDKNRRQWSDPIDFTNAFQYLDPECVVRDRSHDRVPRGQGQSNSRDRGRRGHDGSGSRDRRELREKEPGTCNAYNDEPAGCDFGSKSCKFHHECSICRQKGVKAAHPALYCKGGSSASK